MGTIIDSLTVMLGLDSSKFDAGTKKVDKGLGDITKSATKFLAVIGGSYAMKRFIEDQVASSAALDRLSKNLNENVASVSAWSNAAERAGGSASGLQGTMDMLSKAQTELQLTGQSGLIPYFARMGIAMADMRGQARPTSDILIDLADRFGNMPRTTANNMGRMMGIDQGTMQLLLKGRAEVELLVKRQREQNAVTKLQAEQASRLSAAMIGSRQSFEAFGRELLSRAAPAIEKVFAILEKLGDWARSNREFVEAMLTIIAVGLGAIGAALIPINLTVLAVLGLSAALALVWQDYQTFARGGESLAPWEKWAPGIKTAIGYVKSLGRTLMDAGFRMAAFLDMTAEFYSGNTKGARKAARMMMQGMPSGEPSAAPAAAATSGAMSPQQFFESKGWSAAQAAGIVANLHAESAMNPSAVGDGGKAYGVAQWHPDRQANFAKWAGKDIKGSTLAEQLGFVHYEMTGGTEKGAGAALSGALTAQRAGEVVSSMYERPADRAGEMAKRGKLAKSMLMGIPGASMAARGAGASSGQLASSSSSVETTIGEVKIYTAATDAAGIARDLGAELDLLTPSQANGGLF